MSADGAARVPTKLEGCLVRCSRGAVSPRWTPRRSGAATAQRSCEDNCVPKAEFGNEEKSTAQGLPLTVSAPPDLQGRAILLDNSKTL